MAQTGAELFVQALTQLGIAQIFTLVGDHLNEVLAAAARAGVRLIDMRHESGVTHAADAYARLTRKPAVSLVTGGPGHTNSLTGIATAYLAASPLIAVSGARPTTAGDRQAFQDISQVDMTRPVVKWAAQPPNAAQIPFYLGRAYAEANSGRRGPVHLTIPVDLFTSSTPTPSTAPLPPPQSEDSCPGAADVERMLALLQSAVRPVVIAGSGVWWANAGAELEQFIERTSLPLYTLTMARASSPTGTRWFWGTPIQRSTVPSMPRSTRPTCSWCSGNGSIIVSRWEGRACSPPEQNSFRWTYTLPNWG